MSVSVLYPNYMRPVRENAEALFRTLTRCHKEFVWPGEVYTVVDEMRTSCP